MELNAQCEPNPAHEHSFVSQLVKRGLQTGSGSEHTSSADRHCRVKEATPWQGLIYPGNKVGRWVTLARRCPAAHAGTVCLGVYVDEVRGQHPSAQSSGNLCARVTVVLGCGRQAKGMEAAPRPAGRSGTCHLLLSFLWFWMTEHKGRREICKRQSSLLVFLFFSPCFEIRGLECSCHSSSLPPAPRAAMLHAVSSSAVIPAASKCLPVGHYAK